jgi:CheY-like chemotaxis protein
VVAVTAFVNDESIRRCYEVGMKEVIHKPVSSEVIRDILE